MKKYFLPTILILASGGLLYFYIKNKKDKELNTTEDNETTLQSTTSQSTTSQSTPKQSTPKQSTPKTTISLTKVLKSGSKGLEVKLLQIYLNQYLKPRKKKQLIVDGDFGKDTLIALNWLFRRKQTSIQEIKNLSISQGLDWNLMKKIAKQILAQKKININIEDF
jgi:hypothetical protein